MALNLSQLDGTNGFRLDGGGRSVAGAGDINGDGIGDLLVGNAFADPAGETYVVFGTDDGFATSLDLSTLDGSEGFHLGGLGADDLAGWSVAGIGDINCDGIDDLIIGAPGFYYSPAAGQSYVVFGSSAGIGAYLDLGALDGTKGFRLVGVQPGDTSGFSVAGAGDVNGDGIDDLIIGAPYADADGKSRAGESYIVFGTKTGFPASLDLSALDGTNGFRLDGADANGDSGISVAGADDVNGDGIDDVIVGAWMAGPDGKVRAGASYVVFGADAGFAASLDLSALNGSNGFRLDGGHASDYSGLSVAGAGDINGDGIEDLIIGAPRADPEGRESAGESYVVFGTDTGFPARLDLAALDGSNGFRLEGIDSFDGSGTSVAAAGDINGDGFGDLIVGAPTADPDGRNLAGESYVVFGTDAGFAASLDLSALGGATGFRIDGIDNYHDSGRVVAGAEDINGDGIDDVVLGTYSESYLVFGSAQLGGPNDAPLAANDVLDVGTLDSVDLAADNGTGSDRDPDFDDLSIVAIDGTAVVPGGSVTLASGLRVTVIGGTEVRFDAPNVTIGSVLADDFVYEVSDGRGGSGTAVVTIDFTHDAVALSGLDGSNGFRLDGIDVYDESGTSVAGAGDVNGDGFDDVIVGAPSAGYSYYYGAEGASYVVFGAAAGFAASLDLAALDGSNGFRLDGVDNSDLSGISVAGAGDVNGDGIDDLIIGAPAAFLPGRPNAGESYVVFGSTASFGASFDLTALDGSKGFRLDGISSGRSGGSVAGAGDVNGDGIDDMIIASQAAGTAGASYVVFGNDTGFPASLDLAALDGSNGFRLGEVGSVAGAGDVNGDGIDDMIIEAGADPDGKYQAGESYVVFGREDGFAASIDLSSLDGSNGFRLKGSDAGENSGASVAGAGDVNGDGLDDMIVGAPSVNGLTGASYVVFGSNTGFAASFDLGALDGSNGFWLDGIATRDYSGTAVAGAGDFNGDGIDDLIVGARGTIGVPGTANPEGECYVVFGTDAGFAASLDLSALDGSNGFRLEGVEPYDGTGTSVAGAGDVNQDGFDDVIVGAPRAGGGRGESYIVFGFDTSELLTQISGSPGTDLLTGSDESEAFHPGGGRDRVTTCGGSDTIFFDDRVGKRDVLTVTDFDALSDTLDLGGAAVEAVSECHNRTVLMLEGTDCDAVVLLGLSQWPVDLI